MLLGGLFRAEFAIEHCDVQRQPGPQQPSPVAGSVHDAADAGFSFQSTYTWAKAMQIPGSGYTDPLQRNLDRRRGQEAPHSFRMNGTIELPIGPNKLLFANSSGWIARVIERWQTSFILNLESGSPADITGAGTMRYANGRYVATQSFQIPEGHVEWGASNGNQGRFYGDQYISVVDPQCTDRPGCPNRQPRLCLCQRQLHPQCTGGPGSGGNAGFLSPGSERSVFNRREYAGKSQAWGTGHTGTTHAVRWGAFSLDANAQKTFKLTESKQLSLRIDSTNILNHPQVAIPNFNVASTTAVFGAITGKTGTRTFQGQVRLSF